MALNKDKNLKLYFSISEVAQMFDVNESTLRFWERGKARTSSRASCRHRTIREPCRPFRFYKAS